MIETKPTNWQKLNKASLPINCNQKGCDKNAMFRTKTNSNGEIGFKDLTDYKYYCSKHTYL
jgi:hypothetical protein